MSMLYIVRFMDFIAVCLKRKSNLFLVVFVKYLPNFHPKDAFENISVLFVVTQDVLYL